MTHDSKQEVGSKQLGIPTLQQQPIMTQIAPKRTIRKQMI
jgi:hypothetical protein